MITTRRAALLGLSVPLTPIMVAVLGLWPEPEEPAFELPQIVSGGDNPEPGQFEHDLKERELEDMLEAQNGMILSIIMSAVTEGMML